jgi:hypothetical protein
VRLREWDAEKWLCAVLVLSVSFAAVSLGLFLLKKAFFP